MSKSNNLALVYGKKIVMEMLGFFLFALGSVLYLYSDLGLNPWGILHQGISFQTPLTIGQATQIVGLLLLTISVLFKIVPGVATVLNMIFIGLFTDVIINTHIISTPDSVVLKYIMMLLGNVICAYGMYFYLSQHLGAGPRDGVMLLLQRVTKLDVGVVRVGMEVLAVIAGYLMGGQFGIGTILSALLLGPTVSLVFKIHKYDSSRSHENLFDTFRKVFGKVKAAP
ncbi:MAG TPA: membrane protein [Clostridiaceae bacterium]|nr:membrane protein [Clostridiaceae bacterium]